MTLISAIASNFRELFTLPGVIRRNRKKAQRILDDHEARIRRLEGAPDGPLDAELAAIHHLIPLIITAHVHGGHDGLFGQFSRPYFRARRIENAPTNFTDSAVNPKWVKDTDDDTEEYIVQPTPGATNLFVGCRLWAILSHDAKYWGGSPNNPYEGPVYIPVMGEHLGFQAYLTSSIPEGTSGGSAPASGGDWYEWSQHYNGLAEADFYASGMTVEGFTFGRALHLESLRFDSNVEEHHEPPSGAPLIVRWSPPSPWLEDGGFVFNYGVYPKTDLECESEE